MLFKLYIGSSNETGELEKDKAIKIASSVFDGFTASDADGYWKGKQERSMILEIETKDRPKILGLIKKLTEGLNQEAIGLVQAGAMEFVSAWAGL